MSYVNRNMRANIASPIPQFDGQQERENELIFTCIRGYAPPDIIYTVEEDFPESLNSKLISKEKSGSRESATSSALCA